MRQLKPMQSSRIPPAIFPRHRSAQRPAYAAPPSPGSLLEEPSSLASSTPASHSRAPSATTSRGVFPAHRLRLDPPRSAPRCRPRPSNTTTLSWPRRPTKSVTPLSISTDFAFRAQDAIGWNPRRFRFATSAAAYHASAMTPTPASSRLAPPRPRRFRSSFPAQIAQASEGVIHDPRLAPHPRHGRSMEDGCSGRLALQHHRPHPGGPSRRQGHAARTHPVAAFSPRTRSANRISGHSRVNRHVPRKCTTS